MRVNSRYIPKVIYFFSFFLIYCFGNPLTANAFKKMGSLRKECSTTCHQAKHILKAKKNKFLWAYKNAHKNLFVFILF